MPTTRPDTAFVDGECSACVSHKKRPDINWADREYELRDILYRAECNEDGYNCIVASSGGKDSTWQVLKLKQLGARPLVVTATTCLLTPVGRSNIDNLAWHAKTVEVPDLWDEDYIPWQAARKKLNLIGLETVGDISLPEHMAIFSVPFRVAVKKKIPLIFYGECPQNAWGGPEGTDEKRTMTKRWVMEFGGFLGLRAQDLVGERGLTQADMQYYMLPSDDDMKKVTAYFLGQFCEWDGRRNAEVAVANGMASILPAKCNWLQGENMDNAMTGIHDHQCYRKYGYGRLCAQISADVRHGRIGRDEAMRVVRERDGLFPWIYAGVQFEALLGYLGVTKKQVFDALDKHTNWNLFDQYESDETHLRLREFVCLPAE